MYRSHRILMGDGGYQSEGEGYTFTAITPLRYATACWNAFGQTLTPFPDVTHFPTRYVAASALFPGNAKRGGPPRLNMQGYNGGGGGTHGIRFIAAGFPIIADEYKPAVLWVWNKLKGVEEGKPETLANLVRGINLMDVIHTFVNYPLDMKPVHPAEGLPRTWQARTKGLYLFCNDWRGPNDIILQAYANEMRTHGNSGPDVGGLRLMGLGRAWSHGGGGKKSNAWLNNIPLMVEDGKLMASGGSGRVTSLHTEEDGSGRVSINLDLVYNPKRVRGHDRGGVWPLELPPPGEISGLRAVAVDYSGKCGAPALIVLVDKIKGGPERNWVWHLPPKARDIRVETGANTFTVHQGEASMRGTFVTPGDTTVRAPGVLNLAGRPKKKDEVSAPQPVSFDILAKAPPGQSFFLVMTLQRGKPPEVTVEKGQGLESVVRVGRQRVRFDGENAIIEDVEE